MQKIIPVLFLLLFSLMSLNAQRSFEVFSENPPEFLSQLKEYMSLSQRAEDEEVYQTFEDLFKTGLFTEEETKTIIFTSNRMLGLRMAANPFFKDYLSCLSIVKTQIENSETELSTWHEVLNQTLDGILNKKTKIYSKFLKFSEGFYQAGVLKGANRGTSWSTRQSVHLMKYDNNMPYIEFESTDLVAVRLRDSIQIRQTSGQYFPALEKWVGKGGIVRWNDRFLDLEQDVYAEFPDTFSIRMNTSLYSVESAKLRYPAYFGDKLITGKFEDKIVSDSKDADYPKFESNKKILEIDNIGQGIYFVGGFRLNGLTVYGYGTKDSRANLKIYDDKEERLVYEGLSERVIIKRGEFLLGKGVESTIFFQQDSIYHPAVDIRFNIDDKTLQMTRGQKGTGENPFYSTVHQMNFDAENIHVYFRQDSVEIGKKGIAFDTKPKVYFESLKFFSEGEFLRTKGISDYTPIEIIAVTSEREGTKVLDAELIAKRINAKNTRESIRGELYELVAGGFIDYDDEKHKIYVKDKLLHYAKASKGKVDYDPLKIVSDTDDVNATLNLKTSEISATGIKAIEFSRKQKVAVLPDSTNVKIRKNRDMNFDGKLFAGFSTITGKGFDFEYDRYLINLDSVDFFDLYVPTGELDEKNQPVALSLGSRVEGLNGVLLIDAPSNKSGREDISIFPSFQSKKESYVYYDKPAIQSGVYKRDSFYFELDKFSFNHLDRFTARDIKFPGSLYSFDIMPAFEETLLVRDEDQSLGFIHPTPETGYPLYQERGNYAGVVDLSNRGMIGEGDLTYLGATVYSDDIIFRPYQLTASAKTFDHAENRTDEVQTPKISGLDVAIDWRPYKDSMYVKTKEKPFELYQAGLHTLDGTLILTPGGIKGIGKLDWDQAVMNSPLFAFGANNVKADTTTLKIKAEGGAETALSTVDMNASVDFDEGQATFAANSEKAITKLPYNRYETSINSFAWDMNAEEVRFQSDASKLGAFLSVHPDQDSLRFRGQSAFYDLKNNELQIAGVPHIVSADAFIYPDSNKVTVLPEAVITTLENARIVADTVNKNHVINRATVNILGKRVYTANGFYEYNIGDKKQEIEFSEIKGEPVGKGKYKDKRVATRATGTVAVEDSFYIDLKTEFQGTISLSSDSKALFFDGFARLDEPQLPQRQWFRLRSEGDKEDLVIKYNEPKNQEGIPLETGFFLSKETGIAYPSMMGMLAFRKDRALLPVKGMMRLDPARDEFIFADSSKMVNLDALTGNKLVFSNKTGKIQGEGKFDIGSGLKYIDIEAAGLMQTEMVPVDSGGILPNYQVDADFMATVDLILPDKLIDIIIKDLRSAAFESQAINFIKEPNFYRKAASELFPQNKETMMAIQEVNRGSLNLPAKFNTHTFVFARLPMKWNAEYQSFVTKGSKIGLVSIKGELFNYVYKGYVECRMPSNGDDRLYIYLESPTGNSYYFGFKQGILSITSSNTAFIQAAEALKAKEVILKMDDGETYEIQLVSPGISNMFINRVKAAQK
ncbi:MAG: hypothetical protein AAF847_09970 [Bacteroidota bacterium]